MHGRFGSSAAIEVWAKKKGHQISYTKLYQGDSFPSEVDNIDFLVIMGGPQSPATTLEECDYFDAKSESLFIKKVIDKNKAVLGVCLGAQLIGESLGAKFDHSPNREIGVFDITLTEEGKKDLFFSTVPERFPVGHWHGDMPGLTKDSEILAFSEGCPRQIVRYTPKVYGFQCHFEFNAEAIEGMIKNCSSELEEYKGLPYVQDAEALRGNKYDSINELLFRFLNYIEKVQVEI